MVTFSSSESVAVRSTYFSVVEPRMI